MLASVNVTVGTASTATSTTPTAMSAPTTATSTTPVSTSTLPVVDAPSITGRVQPTSNRLSWDAVTGAAKYQVRHRGSGGSWGTPAETTATARTVNLAANRTYDFQVRAYGNGTERAAAWGEWSNTLVATTGPPPRPQRPYVDGVTQNSVTLSWPKIDGVAWYQVQYRAANSWLRESERSVWTTPEEVKVGGSATITRRVFGLRPQTAYRFRVRFRGDGSRYVSAVGGNPMRGPWSAEVTGTTLAQIATGTISIADLSSKTPQAGQQVTFWVEATDVTPSTRYRIKLTVESGDFGFNRDCSDKVELISNLRPRGGTSLRPQVRIRACSVSTSTVVARLIHDPIGGSRSVLHSHEVTVSTAVPGPPTLAAGAQSAFVGETVTLTASAQSPNAVASYQWQEWSGGSWSDLGATTTSATRDVTSAVAGPRAYRVVVAYGHGFALESSAVVVQWKAIRVGVTSSPAYPRAGEPATSTVTLTADGDVPSGALYQWQEDRGSGWTNLGATTTSPKPDPFAPPYPKKRHSPVPPIPRP